jgi:hypothetical protein
VHQLAANHVVTVDKDDRRVLRGDFGEGRLAVHAKIVETQSSLGVHVVEIGLERNHDGCHRSGFGTGFGSGTLRIASNCCGVKP